MMFVTKMSVDAGQSEHVNHVTITFTPVIVDIDGSEDVVRHYEGEGLPE
jgi:hypothetical protein